MNDEGERYFLTYSGVGLPLRLITPLSADAIANRNTYFCAQFDGAGRIALCRKIVYGEVEFEHRYIYGENGALLCAQITEEEETRVVEFGAQTCQ